MERVVVPYVAAGLHAETEKWAAQFGAVLHELSSSLTTYWETLAAWWQEPGALVVVEHDVVPEPDVINGMLECPQPWCSSPYTIWVARQRQHPIWVTEDGTSSEVAKPGCSDRWLTDGLGCVKFSGQLKQQLPDAITQAGEPDGDGYPHGTWQLLDIRVSRVLRGAGLIPHLHGKSTHLHDYSAARCLSI